MRISIGTGKKIKRLLICIRDTKADQKLCTYIVISAWWQPRVIKVTIELHYTESNNQFNDFQLIRLYHRNGDSITAELSSVIEKIYI